MAISAVLIVSMKIADQAKVNKTQEQVITADSYLDGGMDRTPEPVPEVPGLYESLLADGLEPIEAAAEYCKHIWIQYFCETKVLQAKQFTEYTSYYALDDSNVYIGRRSGGSGTIYQKFSWLDRDSFRYLGNGYFNDKNGLYYDDGEGTGQYPTKFITNVDPKTAQFVWNKGTGFIKDKDHVYYPIGYSFSGAYKSLDTEDLSNVKFFTLKIFEIANPATLQVSPDSDKYLEDVNNYYEDRFGKEEYMIITPKK